MDDLAVGLILVALALGVCVLVHLVCDRQHRLDTEHERRMQAEARYRSLVDHGPLQ